MQNESKLNRYAIIEEKNKREIILLRGRGCDWRRCRFCDYHFDSDSNNELNFSLNQEELNKVTGIYHRLEIVNSGSFIDLDEKTMLKIEQVCLGRDISELHFECHWNHREKIATLKEYFRSKGIIAKVKTGVETFDYLFRESYLDKGIPTDDPREIADFFDECCLLQGIPGQTRYSMLRDITIGLKYFSRVCVNIMQENSKPIKPDPGVIREFVQYIYPIFKDDYRVDILMNNTDFGVGETK